MSSTKPNPLSANKSSTKPDKGIQTLTRLLAAVGLIAFNAQLSAQQAHKFPTPKPTAAHKILENDAGT